MAPVQADAALQPGCDARVIVVVISTLHRGPHLTIILNLAASVESAAPALAQLLRTRPAFLFDCSSTTISPPCRPAARGLPGVESVSCEETALPATVKLIRHGPPLCCIDLGRGSPLSSSHGGHCKCVLYHKKKRVSEVHLMV